MSEKAIVSNKVSLDINKDDVIAIAVSRAERALTLQANDLKAQVAEINKDIQSKIKTLESTCWDNVPADFKAHATAGRDCLRAFGQNTATVDHCVSRMKKVIDVTLNHQIQYGKTRVAGREFSFDELGVTALNDEIIALEEKASNLATKALEIRKQLGNIGTLERAVRGKLAERRLQDVANGEEILAAVIEDLDINVKALPSF